MFTRSDLPYKYKLPIIKGLFVFVVIIGFVLLF